MSSDRRKIQRAVKRPGFDITARREAAAIGLLHQGVLGIGVRLRTHLPAAHMNVPTRLMAEEDKIPLSLRGALRHSRSHGGSHPEPLQYQ